MELRPPSFAARPRLSPGLVALGAGLPLALVFLLPAVRFAGWFLRSLVHELGHTAAAWAFGCPAVPAIRLDGHAAAFHQHQMVPLAILLWAGLGWLAWSNRGRPGLRLLLFPAAALYPLVAFTSAREVVFLFAGHLGELAFATAFFLRALRGGFSGYEGERPLYAALAWFWAGGTTLLAGGILFSAAKRAAYLGNRSFGIANDLDRLAGLLHLPLGVVAFLLLALSLAPLPLALWLASKRTAACPIPY